LRTCYLALKWLLVGLGVYGAMGLAVLELRERRVGLGVGLAVVILFAVTKGTLDAVRRSRSHP